MSRIRGHGNKDTELVLMRLFRLSRITGWRRRQRIFGRPDFVFRNSRVVVFVDGCFWHGCRLHYNKPANNRAFWRRKFVSNNNRDRLVNRELRRRGWRVLRIWEHELTNRNQVRCMLRIQRFLENG